MHNTLSVITLMTPIIDYEMATKIVQQASINNEPLAMAAESLGLCKQTKFESLMNAQLETQLLHPEAHKVK